MTTLELNQLAQQAGFSYMSPLDIQTVTLKPEVRQMCAGNSCGQYGKRWSCPPGCGELDVLQQRLTLYSRGILVQTVGQLEDSFDAEGMLAAEQAHKTHLTQLQDKLLAHYPKLLTIGAGCCTHCNTCTYPHAPCRFPDRQVSSMEAYGMLVSEVCQKNGMKYYYGPGTIAYTSCFLLE